MRVEEACGFGKGAKPEVGMPCTLHMYSDSQACEVVKVSKSGKTCWIRRNVVTVDPNSEGGIGHQEGKMDLGELQKRMNTSSLELRMNFTIGRFR